MSFTLHTGEVLGVGGLAGHGHRELFMLLFGAQRMTGGTLLVQRPAGAAAQPARRGAPGGGPRAGAGGPQDRGPAAGDEHPRQPDAVGPAPHLARRRAAQAAGAASWRRTMAAQLRVRMPGLGAPVGALSAAATSRRC